MPLSHDQLLKTRSQYLGYDAWELGGGDFFFNLFHHQLGFHLQICVIMLHRVALYMRDNEEIWRTWRFMEDISATAIWLVHVAFMFKAMQKLLPHQTLFSRLLLILGANKCRSMLRFHLHDLTPFDAAV